MKKKILFAIMCICVLTIGLAGCGKDKKEEPQTAEEALFESETAEEADEDALEQENITGEVSEQESIIEETIESEKTQEKSTHGVIPEFKKEAKIEETVIYDENNVKITATELSYNNYTADLNIIIENNSDADLSFISGSIGYSANSVNGYMVNMYLNSDVTAGNKANEKVSISLNELLLHGITEIADIQISFQIDSGNFDYEYTGPLTIPTSISESYDYSIDRFKEALNTGVYEALGLDVMYKSLDEIYNQNGVSVIAEAFVKNKDGESMLIYEISNETDKMINAQSSNVSVNGLVLYSGTWGNATINPGCKIAETMNLNSLIDSNTKELFGISDIGDISFNLSIADEKYNELFAPINLNIVISDSDESYDTSGNELFNESGIRITSKGLAEDESDYSDDLHWIILVENSSDNAIYIDDKYDSFSVNGFMSSVIAGSTVLDSGQAGIIDVEMSGYSLEDNNISGINDIESVEITFEIKDNGYNSIATAKVKETIN